MSYLAVVQPLCALLLGTLPWLAAATPITTRDCLSGICIEETPSSAKAAMSRLGLGVKVHRSDDVGDSMCYWSEASGLTAEFTFAGKEEAVPAGSVRGITLTKVKLCNRPSGSRLGRLETSLAGVTIGQTEAEVLGARGPASRIDDALERERSDPRIADTRYSSKFGERVYVYDKPDDLKVTFVFFKAGRVHTVWVSSGE